MSQLRNLQMQINPHFLGNCFNAVYNASLTGDFEQVLALTTYLNRYFRFMAQVEMILFCWKRSFASQMTFSPSRNSDSAMPFPTLSPSRPFCGRHASLLRSSSLLQRMR